MSKVKFKPLADRVLVEPEAAEEKTASGIIIPDTAKEKPQKGKIIAATSKLANGGELMLISDSRFLSDEGGMSIPDNIVFIMMYKIIQEKNLRKIHQPLDK